MSFLWFLASGASVRPCSAGTMSALLAEISYQASACRVEIEFTLSSSLNHVLQSNEKFCFSETNACGGVLFSHLCDEQCAACHVLLCQGMTVSLSSGMSYLIGSLYVAGV